MGDNVQRFPYCVVWTPIPLLTWLFPIIGHMGICTSAGVIRDFAGPYFVSYTWHANFIHYRSLISGRQHGIWKSYKIPYPTYFMAVFLFVLIHCIIEIFTRFWRLKPSKADNGQAGWDNAVLEASEKYKGRMHNLFCDNCHSHVACALNMMNYDGLNSWNMVRLCFLMLVHGKYVSFWAIVKTWLPFVLLVTCIMIFILVFG